MPHKDPEARREYDRERARKRRREDPDFLERQRAAGRKYAANNRERQRASSRAYHARNLEAVREKARIAARERRAGKTPDELWAQGIWIRHRMQPAQWQAMYDEQDGKCYLCLRPLPENRTKISLDHDHACCRKDRSCSLCRRGLACTDCNSGIGWLGDSPERMRLAADNLERVQAVTRARMASTSLQESLF